MTSSTELVEVPKDGSPRRQKREARPRRAGQIIERGERVQLVRVFLGRDDKTGKRRYLNKTIHGTKKDAQRFLNGILRELDLGTFVEPSATTLGEYLDKWLESAAKPRLSERTFADYSEILKRYVRDELGGRRLSEIRPLEVQALYNALQERGLSARTVRMTHVILSNALKQAVRWQMLTFNPAQHVELPKKKRQEMRALSPEESTRFLEAANEDRHGIIFALALATGAGPEEYTGLKWGDVDWQKGTVTIQRALCWRRQKGGGWYFKEPKTSQSRRTIPIPQPLVGQLAEHKRQQAEMRLKMGSEWQNNDLVFATAEGGPIHSEKFKRSSLQTDPQTRQLV